MEPDEAVDHETGAECGCETALSGDEVWVCGGAGRGDSGVNDERYDGEEHINVEECRNLFATYRVVLVVNILYFFVVLLQHTDCRELGPHMYNHNHRHDQGQNVHEVVGGLEDERIRQLNRPRVACRLYAGAGASDG